MPLSPTNLVAKPLFSKELTIAAISLVAIVLHVALKAGPGAASQVMGASLADVPLFVALVAALPLLVELGSHLLRGEFNADLLAGLSIVTSVVLGEYLAGTLVVLMLSGGQTLESYAVRHASFALEALAQRLPAMAHRNVKGTMEDVALSEIVPGDVIVVFPYETCPVDGVVVEGHSTMNEAYLTGEPYMLPKAVGAMALSGSINGEGALTIRAEKAATDSRYAKIMQVMRDSENHRPQLRRLGDQIGAFYTPLAIFIAVLAWFFSGEATRFLGVLVIATPCPLLIAIPVAIIGSVSLSARRGIIIKDPGVLERIDLCRVAIFDKTGTLTYGLPKVTEILPAPGFEANDCLAMVASIERYSRHPLAAALVEAAQGAGLALHEPSEISERPGEGMRGVIENRTVQITGRNKLARTNPVEAEKLPPLASGLECLILIDGHYAATFRFRDEPRPDGKRFVEHLSPRHGFSRVLLVSGDRESEVRYLADKVGIHEVYAGQSPEQKLELVQKETRGGHTLFMGDGINDAPALTAASVGIAFGQGSDVTAEAASVVILDSSLQRVDELIHIGKRMRRIALQSAVGGMLLSIAGMIFAAAGLVSPVAGAISQELIDVLAVLNALRASFMPTRLSDYISPD